MSIKSIRALFNPNVLLGRSIWSTPQGREELKEWCGGCKHFVLDRPFAMYDPANQKSYGGITQGKCSNLRIMAAYGRPPSMFSYYTCSFFERKEKENAEEK